MLSSRRGTPPVAGAGVGLSVHENSLIQPMTSTAPQSPDKDNPVLKEGDMFKQGPPPWKSWNKRLCVVTPQMLLYYTPAKNPKSKNNLKGQLPLANVTSIEILKKGTPEFKRNFSFKIITTKRNFCFACENEKDLQDWIYVLKEKKAIETTVPVEHPNKNSESLKESESLKTESLDTDTIHLSSNPLFEVTGLERDINKIKQKYKDAENLIVEQLIKKEMEEIIVKYDKERTAILAEIKNRAEKEGITIAVPGLEGGKGRGSGMRGKSNYNRQSVRRAYYAKGK
eukprot:TRINITY_DN6320_c0_g1_i1.p1 TRINITY_DN6320_c0_g1~~TRINITY_DN6320_c0_g1_i1.p1  ORF type:complete len:284 (-),score=62.70 TRINITY_DN6320_c0_g1_i1:33-884(-)